MTTDGKIKVYIFSLIYYAMSNSFKHGVNIGFDFGKYLLTKIWFEQQLTIVCLPWWLCTLDFMSTTLAKGSGDGPVLGQEHPEVIVSDEKLLLGCFTSFGTT